MSAARQRDVHARIDQNTCPVWVLHRQNTPHQIAQFARRQILFANLDQLHATGKRAPNVRHQWLDTACGAAIGNVVAQHYTGV